MQTDEPFRAQGDMRERNEWRAARRDARAGGTFDGFYRFILNLKKRKKIPNVAPVRQCCVSFATGARRAPCVLTGNRLECVFTRKQSGRCNVQGDALRNERLERLLFRSSRDEKDTNE